MHFGYVHVFAASSHGPVGGLGKTQAVGNLVKDVNVAVGAAEGVLARSKSELDRKRVRD